jgi:hypothetical protein
MTSRTTTKLTLALVGMVLFGAGIRFDAPSYRWAGLALVAVAWFMRFWKGPAPKD